MPAASSIMPIICVFFERGRSECLRLLGIDHAAHWRSGPEDERAGFAVRRVEIDYLIPALLDDALIICTTVEEPGAAYVDVRQKLMRDEDCLARAMLRVALVDVKGRPRRLPKGWRDRLQAFARQADIGRN